MPLKTRDLRVAVYSCAILIWGDHHMTYGCKQNKKDGLKAAVDNLGTSIYLVKDARSWSSANSAEGCAILNIFGYFGILIGGSI